MANRIRNVQLKINLTEEEKHFLKRKENFQSVEI